MINNSHINSPQETVVSSSMHKERPESSIIRKLGCCLAIIAVAATQGVSASPGSPELVAFPYDNFHIAQGHSDNYSLDTNVTTTLLASNIEHAPWDQELAIFQDQILGVLNSGNYTSRPAKSGINECPIIYDAISGKPIGIMKGSTRHKMFENWKITCKMGDVIAYKLDHGGYAGVPPAFLIDTIHNPQGETLEHPEGVIAKWLPNTHDCSLRELSTLDIEQRQAISILDIRLGNEDRNIGNLQIDDNRRVYPIDHDRIFYTYTRKPRAFKGYAKKGLTKKATKYINSLKINKDIEIMRQHGIEEREISNLVIRTTFLKLAAKAPRWKKITLDDLERLLELARLPSDNVSKGWHNWIHTHPLHKILNQLNEPYTDTQLRNAFKEIFNQYIEKTQNRWNFLHADFYAEKLQELVGS